ncbi:MAG: PhnD/SsuA/transferrin family substrate-binding protein [Deltaproteobacteria bacterium]|nr:PhnD/SsuA/transferrin family substrate-binding protein [Deltaproteobacteria bacterium]
MAKQFSFPPATSTSETIQLLSGLRKLRRQKDSPLFTLNSFFFLLLFFLSFSAVGQEKLTMAFIYPGGEGSAEEAQPILDRFFAMIREKRGPLVSGAYYPALEEGLAAVKAGKAQAGIVSLETYLTRKKNWPMEILLATLPAASNNQMERYFFLTTAAVSETLEPAKPLAVYTSKAMNPVLFKSILMTNIPADFQADFRLETAPNLLGQLKKLASGEALGGALLDNYEYVSLKKLDLDWVKKLKLVYSSPLVPAPPVVLFTPLPEMQKQNLIQALMALPDSLDGREVLKSFRFKGFAKPQMEAYQALDEAFENALVAAPSIPAESPN